MAVHRRQLPLAYRCEGFVPAPGSTGEGGFCESCRKQVHDVSAMRESELRRLLAAHVGETICLAYRADAHGRVQLRPEPAAALLRPLALGALAMLLAACAGHATELEVPGTVCRDADGYAIACPEWPEPGMLSVPEESEDLAGCDPGVEGCPIRPTAPEGEGVAVDMEEAEEVAVGPVERGVVHPIVWSDEVTPAEPTSTPDDAPPEASPAAERVPVGANLEAYVGAVYVIDAPTDPSFVSTSELLRQWRDRRAERKQDRLRRRNARRATASG